MKITSTTCYCAVPITNNSYSCKTLYPCSYYPPSGIYDKFIGSLGEAIDKTALMNHLPKDIEEVSRVFPGYLTDEELQETQYKGRFWDICKMSHLSGSFMYYLYILVDNETLVIVDNEGMTQILGRNYLPYSLQGIYYDEC